MTGANPQNQEIPEKSGVKGAESQSDQSAKDGFQIQFARHIMACPFEILLNPDHPKGASEAAVRALDRVSELEALLSIYRNDSEFTKLNAIASSQEVRVSQSTFHLLELATTIHRLTYAAYDITSATLSNTWGFHRRQGRMPQLADIQEALSNRGTQYLKLDSSNLGVRFLKEGLQINPGGIGKGFALDVAAKELRSTGVADFLVHGGKSSVYAIGNQSGCDHSGWRIAVRHPYNDQLLMGEIHLDGLGLGTSGAANQFFYFQGKRYGHVIDPRTGWPAQHWLSTTVLAESAAVADAISTACFVMSPEELHRFAMENQSLGIIAMKQGGREGETEVITYHVDGKYFPA